MKDEKIERIFAHLQNAQAELNAGILLFNKLLGEMDAEDDVAIFRRSQLYFVEKSPDEVICTPKVRQTFGGAYFYEKKEGI